MSLTIATILWKRLDTPGHEACRLVRRQQGWQLEGDASFVYEGDQCNLSYEVQCDETWRTLSAHVAGLVRSVELNCRVQRMNDGTWFLNEVTQPNASGCVDLDLGFTPATNLIAVRRLNLAIGQERGAPAAYLSFPEFKLELLEQHYHRTHRTKYAYRAPSFGYFAVLEVSDIGFITSYPGLWEGKLVVNN